MLDGEPGGAYFSDLYGGVYRVDARAEVALVVPKRRPVGGIALHAEGGIVVTGRTVCHVRDGRSQDLLAIDGVVFNDLCTDEHGQVWVGGSALAVDGTRPDQRTGSIFRIGLDARADVVFDGLGIPNGMAFSPDGARLYVVDSSARTVYAVDQRAREPSLEVFIDLSGGGPPDFGFPPRDPTPDGLAVDDLGGVWLAMLGRGTVERFDSAGHPDVVIDIGTPLVTSLAFGGPDRSDLYVTTGGSDVQPIGSLLRHPTSFSGVPHLPARV